MRGGWLLIFVFVLPIVFASLSTPPLSGGYFDVPINQNRTYIFTLANEDPTEDKIFTIELKTNEKEVVQLREPLAEIILAPGQQKVISWDIVLPADTKVGDEFQIEYKITDGIYQGVQGMITFGFTFPKHFVVRVIAHPPVLILLPEFIQAKSGELFVFQITCTDEDSDILTFTSSKTKINKSSGLIEDKFYAFWKNRTINTSIVCSDGFYNDTETIPIKVEGGPIKWYVVLPVPVLLIIIISIFFLKKKHKKQFPPRQNIPFKPTNKPMNAPVSVAPPIKYNDDPFNDLKRKF